MPFVPTGVTPPAFRFAAIWCRAAAVLFAGFIVTAAVVQFAAGESFRLAPSRLIAAAAGAAVEALIVAAIVRRRIGR